MYSESQLLPISALQHLQFCARQWGLIHLEQVWGDNALTARGNVMHSKVHSVESESRNDLRIARGLRICSYKLGLIGQCDVIEFSRLDKHNQNSITLPDADGYWQVFPVEYKRGKPKKNKCDEVQLCAQVLCLEEMLQVCISQAALYYGMPRKRHHVLMSDDLRQRTFKLALKLHDLHEAGITPKAKYCRKCQSCSLFKSCMPKVTGIEKKVNSYIKKNIQDETIA